MTSEDQVKYYYFHSRARGELPRLVAAYCGIDIQEEMLTLDQWAPYKENTPYGQVPFLEVGGKYYAQKMAISYYLAETYNKDLLGKTPLENLEINQSLFFTEDLLEMIVSALVDRDILKLGSEKLDNVLKNEMPGRLEYGEKMLQKNRPTYFVGNRMTIADLSAFDVLEHLVDLEGEKYLDNYPTLKAHFHNIAGMESIKNHRENARSKCPTFTW